MKSKKKIVIWGLGVHSIRNIIPAIKNNENLKLYGLFTRDIEKLKFYSKKFQCHFWESSEKMLKDPSIDIVYLSTPTGLHYRQSLKILKSKKHLWVEKVITTNFKETKHLIELANKTSLSICEGFMFLYHPQFIGLKKSLKIIGKINLINCLFSLPKLENPGFRINKNLGASALLDLGSYGIALIINLFKIEEIELIESNLNYNSSNIDISGNVSFRINNNCTFSFYWAYDSSYRNDIQFWGNKGSIFIDKIFSKKKDYVPITFHKNKHGDNQKEYFQTSDHFELMFEQFYQSMDDSNKKKIISKSILNCSYLLDKIKFHNKL